MNFFAFTLAGAELTALPNGALWWQAERVLTVSDLHFGKARRAARRGGALLPPYEVRDTLLRLEAAIDALSPATVICLGDNFDDLPAADELEEADRTALLRLMAGRRWLWVEGNHDPGPVGLGGSHVAEVSLGPLAFRHVATAARGEISGHYHPKARLGLGGAGISRPCFLIDGARVILPAFGTYTGGLGCANPVFSTLMAPNALAVLTGSTARAVPMAAVS